MFLRVFYFFVLIDLYVLGTFHLSVIQCFMHEARCAAAVSFICLTYISHIF